MHLEGSGERRPNGSEMDEGVLVRSVVGAFFEGVLAYEWKKCCFLGF